MVPWETCSKVLKWALVDSMSGGERASAMGSGGEEPRLSHSSLAPPGIASAAMYRRWVPMSFQIARTRS